MPAEPSRPFRQYRINSACTREGGGEEGHVKNIGNRGAAARSASALLLEEGLGGQRAAIPVCFRPPVAGGGGVLCFYHRGSCSSLESQPLHLYRRWQYLECRSARDEHFQHSHVCKGSYSTFGFGSCCSSVLWLALTLRRNLLTFVPQYSIVFFPLAAFKIFLYHWF